jgi:hypothetical protein
LTIKTEVLKRLEIAEKKLAPKALMKCVIKDTNGLYSCECGHDLSQDQYEAWVKQQDKNNQIIVIEICENKPQRSPGGQAI